MSLPQLREPPRHPPMMHDDTFIVPDPPMLPAHSAVMPQPHALAVVDPDMPQHAVV